MTIPIATAQGWPLIKLSKPTGNGPAPGKRPIGRAWQKQAGMTPEAAQDALETGHNLGVLCGGAARLMVVDIDGDIPDGLPDTPTVQTGGGGWHYYYHLPEGVDIPKANKCGKVAPDVDIRYTGAQVVYPGSVHAETGAVYEWVPGKSPDDLPLADVPQWIIDKLRGEARAINNGNADAFLSAALQGACDDIRQAVEGTRNDTLNTRAYHLGGYPFTDWQQVAGALLSAAMDAGLPEVEAKATIQSGLRAGRANPRGIPDNKPVTVTAIGPKPAERAPFKALGYYGDRMYFLPRTGGQVVDVTAQALSSVATLLRLAPLQHWERHYPSQSGVKTSWAADDLIGMCYAAGLYDARNVRGRGAWHDDGRIVLHRGNSLLVDGADSTLVDIKSKYIYQREHRLNLPYDNPLTQQEAAEGVLDLCNMLSWDNSNFGNLLAGWLALAPICGVLTWRPHIWISGPSGSGKTWVQEHIVEILGNTILKVQGCSTEAGIRQLLGCDALAVSFDEAESDGQRNSMKIQQVLELARQASSSSGGVIAKGSADGQAQTFNIRSMFIMSSVGVGVTRRADQSRVTVLSLRTPPSGAEGWNAFRKIENKTAECCTGIAASRFIARSLRQASAIRASAHTFAGALVQGTNRRNADQIGALLAGYWSYRSDEPATEEDARVICNDYDVDAVLPAEDGADEQQLLDYLMRRVVRCELRDYAGNTHQVNRTVQELVNGATSDDRGEEQNLQRLGLRIISGRGLFISNKNPELSKLLCDTQWGNDWNQFTRRLDGVDPRATARINGATVRGVLLPFTLVSDE